MSVLLWPGGNTCPAANPFPCGLPRPPPLLRLPQPLYDRLFDVIAATGNEVTRSGVIVKALETYLAILECNPGMLAGYDSGRDRSATQKDET